MGLANTGGLFIPYTIPKVQIPLDTTLPDVAFIVFRSYISKQEIDDQSLRTILTKSLQSMDIPIKQLSDCMVAELFHGPTFSFKDFALQVLGNFFEFFLSRRKDKQTYNVVCATSGDTGSAAIYGLKGKESINCFVLYPHNKGSQVQRKQMTTIDDTNIHCIAVDGTFDNCQSFVKQMLLDTDLQDYNISAVNSINWARILTQISYYSYISVKLLHKPFNVSVPTGNFGNVLSAYYAKLMGLPIKKLIVATNENDILHQLFQIGEYKVTRNYQTYSPSMDISVASNFERLLWLKHFQVYKKHSKACQMTLDQMIQFNEIGNIRIDKDIFSDDFLSQRVSNFDTLVTIKTIHSEENYVIDPHTAVGMHAFQGCKIKLAHPTVCIATAHPAKFVDTMQECFEYTSVPTELRSLYSLPEKYIMFKDYEDIKMFIRNTKC
jgi:threonine synthase